MQRLATTVAIAAWIGFLGVFSLELAADVMAPELLDAAAAVSWPPALSAQFGGVAGVLAGLTPPLEILAAAASLAIVALFGRSLILLHAPRHASTERGETLALAGLAAAAVLAGAAQVMSVPLLPIDLDGSLVWLAIALSIAAVVFDRLVAIETSEEHVAEIEFHASLSALAERMGRQAALYTLPDGGPTDGRGPASLIRGASASKDRRP